MIHLADTPVLRTERLILRAPAADDWPHWQRFHASPRAAGIGGAGQDPAAAWRLFAAVIGHWILRGCGWFVIHRREDATPLGTAGPWFPEGWPEREVGWTLWSKAAEGQGFAAEAGRAVLEHVFRDLDWPTAVSYVYDWNTRSIALAERLGGIRDDDAPAPKAGVLVYRHGAPA
ncbi:MAG: GNAT family N-acetyltransferase [Pseudomonadota bacterium]